MNNRVRGICPDCGKSVEMIKFGWDKGRQRWKIFEHEDSEGCRIKTVNPIFDELYFHDLEDEYNQEHDNDETRISTKLAAKTQRLQDQNRIANKTFRNDARLFNALSDYSQAIKTLLEKHSFSPRKKLSISKKKNKCYGVIHLTDVHFDEIVYKYGKHENKYDFNVAASRLAYFADRAIQYFRINNVDKVLIAMTGDLINSDRHADEFLNNATNRSKATFLAVDILQQFINHVSEEFEVTVSNVSGNEGRVRKEHEFTDIIATDNYDWTIFNMLRVLFKQRKQVKFITGLAREVVIGLGNINILLTHGENLIGDVRKKIQHLIGKYSSKKINVDFVLFGHTHEAYVSDYFARGGSVVGGNDYSDRMLNYVSRASQNLHLFYEDGKRESIKVDLQFDEYGGSYNIQDEVNINNPKNSMDQIEKLEVFKI